MSDEVNRDNVIDLLFDDKEQQSIQESTGNNKVKSKINLHALSEDVFSKMRDHNIDTTDKTMQACVASFVESISRCI